MEMKRRSLIWQRSGVPVGNDGAGVFGAGHGTVSQVGDEWMRLMHAQVPPRVFPVRQAAQGQQPVRVRIGVGVGVWVNVRG
jgi:hypothetical protein